MCRAAPEDASEETLDRLPTSATCMNLLKLPPYRRCASSRAFFLLNATFYLVIAFLSLDGWFSRKINQLFEESCRLHMLFNCLVMYEVWWWILQQGDHPWKALVCHYCRGRLWFKLVHTYCWLLMLRHWLCQTIGSARLLSGMRKLSNYRQVHCIFSCTARSDVVV